MTSAPTVIFFFYTLPASVERRCPIHSAVFMFFFNYCRPTVYTRASLILFSFFFFFQCAGKKRRTTYKDRQLGHSLRHPSAIRLQRCLTLIKIITLQAFGSLHSYARLGEHAITKRIKTKPPPPPPPDFLVSRRSRKRSYTGGNLYIIINTFVIRSYCL